MQRLGILSIIMTLTCLPHSAFARFCEGWFIGKPLSVERYMAYKKAIATEDDPQEALAELASQGGKADPNAYLAWATELDPDLNDAINNFYINTKRLKIPSARSLKTLFQSKTQVRMVDRMLDIVDQARTREEVTRLQSMLRFFLPHLYIKAQLSKDVEMLKQVKRLSDALNKRGILNNLNTDPLKSKPRRIAKHALSWTAARALSLLTLWFFYDMFKNLYETHEQIEKIDDATEKSKKRTEEMKKINRGFDDAIDLLNKRFPELSPVQQ